MTLKRNQEIEVTIEKLVHGGVGFATHDGLVIMVSGGVLPQQKIKARILRKKKKYAKAQCLEVLERSADELTPICPHFGPCGGCKWLTLPYEKQLSIKHQIVSEALFKSHTIQPFEIRPIIPSPIQLGYRNKLEYTFGKETFPSDEFHLGFHKQGRLFDIVDIERCHFTETHFSEIARDIKNMCFESGLPVHSTCSHTGFFRYLIMRTSEKSDTALINLVHYEFADREEEKLFDVLKKELKLFAEKHEHIESFVLSKSLSRADVAKGDVYEVLTGEGIIHEAIGDFTFQISPYSFFQTNSSGAKVLYDEAMKAAELSGSETILDLYAGTGTIGIYTSQSAKKVYSVELLEEAVEDAKKNAKLNNVTNLTPIAGKAEDKLPALLEDGIAFDCVFIDPPRSGMHPKALETIIGLQPEKLVYVSCNPATLNRDLELLLEQGYHIHYVQPVDMFPQTHHVECVVLLTCDR